MNIYQEVGSENRSWPLAVIFIGISSVVTQVLLLRELLSVFYGNELAIGIVLTLWMLLTGAGSYLGKYAGVLKNSVSSLAIILISLSVIPLFVLALLPFVKDLLFPAGIMLDVSEICSVTLFFLSPYCLVSGFAFVFAANVISEKNSGNLISWVYSLESLGSVIGGFIVNFILIFFFQTYQSFLFLAAVNFLLIAYILYQARKLLLSVPIILAALAAVIAGTLFNFDHLLQGKMYPGQELLSFKNTPYGSIAVTKQGGQLNFFENNLLLFSTGDPSSNEEAVHYAMLQHPRPESVLLISGGISGMTDEALKYDVRKIDYIEINPWIVEIGEKYIPGPGSGIVNVIEKDPRLYVKTPGTMYDVVIINLPGPVNAQLNRIYTVEFFRELKKRCSPGAVVGFGLLEGAEYSGKEAKMMNSIIFNTAGEVFKNVIVIPGLRNYFVVSDNPLSVEISRMITEKGIQNKYVNQYYIDDLLLETRHDKLMQSLVGGTRINQDFIPVSYYQHMLYWLSHYDMTGLWIIVAILAAMIVTIALRLDAFSIGIFTGGYSALSIEIVILLSYQAMYGYLYRMLGFIIMIFMAGLSAGSYYRRISGSPSIKKFILLQWGMTAYALSLPVFLIVLRSQAVNPFTFHAIYFVLTFIIGLLVGMEFSVVTRIRPGTITSVSSSVYAVDLLGSACGALLTSVIFIPLAGIVQTCFIMAGLNAAGAVLTSIIGKGRF